jgi:hypothetical protein
MVAIVNQIFTEVRFPSFWPSRWVELVWKGYPKYKRTFGEDQAKKILENEKVRDLLYS